MGTNTEPNPLDAFMAKVFSNGVPAIMCLGNETLGDDGVGIWLANELQSAGYPSEKLLVVHTVPESFISKILPGTETLLMIDAGGLDAEPGDLAMLEDIRELHSSLSTHRLPIGLFMERVKLRGVSHSYALLVQAGHIDFLGEMSEPVIETARNLLKVILQHAGIEASPS